MKFSESVKPISYLKAHAAEVIRDVVNSQQPLIITQRGKAKVVVQDVVSYEQIRASLAMLKILALSTKHIQDGKYEPAAKAFDDIELRIKARRSS